MDVVINEQHAQIPVIPIIQRAQQTDAGKYREGQGKDDLSKNPPFARSVNFGRLDQLVRN
ncbi:hypothetical protein D3C71_1980660 [compost metagenome]